jgi:protein involved in polysaccharide export with SLBB domain
MYYEMKPTETVADLLRYSGGFTRDAYRGDVRIERMGERERQIYTLDGNEQKNFPVRDGDIMSVDSIRDTYENMVEVKGAFYRPGKFQCGAEISTVRELIEKAGGLRPDAFLNRGLLNRRLPDMTMENLSIDVKGIMAGTSADVALRPNDVLYIPSVSEVEEIKILTIHGEVSFPGKYRYAENTTVEDLILLAGGLKDKASTAKVDVARRTRNSDATTSGDTIAQIFTFSIDKGLVVSGDPSFKLQPYDAVYVRRSPMYYEQQNVEIVGEVSFAGTYVLDRKGLRLSDIIKNSGGLTDKAYTKGARLERKMTAEERQRMLEALKTVQKQMDSLDISEIDIKPVMQVGIELDKAIKNPGSDADIVLEDGDRLVIPQLTNTVKVDGNVMFPNAVAYKEGAKLKHYIEQAGGYGMNAKKTKAIVVYMNGTVARAKKNSKDLIQPGCQIIVPSKLARKGMSTSEILSLSSTSASLATVVLALINLIK